MKVCLMRIFVLVTLVCIQGVQGSSPYELHTSLTEDDIAFLDTFSTPTPQGAQAHVDRDVTQVRGKVERRALPLQPQKTAAQPAVFDRYLYCLQGYSEQEVIFALIEEMPWDIKGLWQREKTYLMTSLKRQGIHLSSDTAESYIYMFRQREAVYQNMPLVVRQMLDIYIRGFPLLNAMQIYECMIQQLSQGHSFLLYHLTATQTFAYYMNKHASLRRISSQIRPIEVHPHRMIPQGHRQTVVPQMAAGHQYPRRYQ